MTAQAKFRGIKEARSATKNGYDECPSCGSAKRTTSKLCSSCRYDKKREIEQPHDPLIRHIPLTKGQVAIIDAKHFERLGQYRYIAQWSPVTESFYAIRFVTVGKGKQARIPLHLDVMNLALDGTITIDHRETSQTLDNRESNLRLANKSDQACNRRLFSNNTSGYKGVRRNNRSQAERWIAEIVKDGKRTHLGTRSTAQAAYLELYVPAAEKLHGEFARLDLNV